MIAEDKARNCMGGGVGKCNVVMGSTKLLPPPPAIQLLIIRIIQFPFNVLYVISLVSIIY